MLVDSPCLESFYSKYVVDRGRRVEHPGRAQRRRSCSLCHFMCQGIGFSRNPDETLLRASAANGEEHKHFDADAVRRLPLLFLEIIVLEPLPEATENEASTLILVHPYGGGFQELKKINRDLEEKELKKKLIKHKPNTWKRLRNFLSNFHGTSKALLIHQEWDV